VGIEHTLRCNRIGEQHDSEFSRLPQRNAFTFLVEAALTPRSTQSFSFQEPPFCADEFARIVANRANRPR
jgi:hypothetical protein